MTQNTKQTKSKKEKYQKNENLSDEGDSFIVQSDNSSQSCSFKEERDYVPSKSKKKRMRIESIPENSRTLRTRKNINYAIDVETDDEKENYQETRKSKRLKSKNIILESSQDTEDNQPIVENELNDSSKNSDKI
jgi:hypothetical protein